MPTPGPLELVIILVIALLILGPGKLPDVGAALGKSIKEFRKASTDVQEAVSVNVDTSPIPAAPPAAPVTPTATATTPAAGEPAPALPTPAEPVDTSNKPATTTADSSSAAR
jgi:TatA/E family protein of Tat protein translocase